MMSALSCATLDCVLSWCFLVVSVYFAPDARSGDKARMIRCPGCHSTSSLYSTSNSDDDDGNGVGSRISSITSTAAGLKTTLKSVCADSISEQVILLRAMKAYAYNEVGQRRMKLY